MKIIDWNRLRVDEKSGLLKRPSVDADKNIDQVKSIIDQVKSSGDAALLALTKKLDQVELTDLQVSEAEFEKAEQTISEQERNAILTAINRIENYQQHCYPKTITIDTDDGIQCQRIPKPLQRVGLYVPGGSAPLVSTVMMLAIPAKIAGCQTRVLCTPPIINPILLVTAKLCGIDTIFKVGGAQAIAAMAYGTATIPKVDKLFGPGNNWVTSAKQVVSTDDLGASIDMPAGPSELLVIADRYANSQFIAADLLSQAEHGPDSQVIFLSNSETLAQSVMKDIKEQIQKLSRKDIIQQSLKHSQIILTKTIDQAIEISNQYSPEHLILQIHNPEKSIHMIQNAGAVFVGPWTAETMGDYITGANHVLPTNGYANRYSGLSVNDFMRYISVQKVMKNGLDKYGPLAMDISEIEGLSAHKNAVKIRLQETCDA
jgi:histidinol dehydrogenase